MAPFIGVKSLFYPVGLDCQAHPSTDRAATCVPPSVGLRPLYGETPAAILILIDARSGPDRRAALEAAGITLLYLPAYSPDLNPIEMVFAKTKALLRKAAVRTVDALWRALGTISQSLTPEECVNYIRHCGYVQSG